KYFLLIGLIILLSGCSSINEPLDSNALSGFDYIVYPFTIFIKKIAHIFNENYGLAIIIITLLIRLVLMPFMLKQMKSIMLMKKKMNLIKLDLNALKKKYKDKKILNHNVSNKLK